MTPFGVGEMQAEITDLRQQLALAQADSRRLRATIAVTLRDNLGLAGGENCTLIELKRALWTKEPRDGEAVKVLQMIIDQAAAGEKQDG